MPQKDRRRFRRARLRLRIARLEGLGQGRGREDLWTTDVSAGGMFFHAPLVDEPAVGTNLTFELRVPPGEGYSSSAGKVRGSGKVIRAVAGGGAGTGLAVQFTRSLALDF